MIFIDNGSSADVYLNPETNQIHKVFYEEEPFYKEWKMLESITEHEFPFILDYSFDEDEISIQMNYVPYNLENVINQETDISIMNKNKLLFNIINAMKSLHEKGIVHNDLKAKNILIDEDETVYLIDFDLCEINKNIQTTKFEDYKKMKFLILQIIFEISYETSYKQYHKYLSKLNENHKELYSIMNNNEYKVNELINYFK